MRHFIIVVLCLLLSACFGPVAQRGGSYPAEITGIGESANFPTSAAGYTRGKMFMYEPGMKNHSIAYHMFEPTLHNTVTLYFYEAPMQIEELFEAEKRQIIAAHPGATIVSESPMTIQKAGVSYQAYAATFNFTGNFAWREQPVSSLFILVSTPERYFKVRSTAPLSEAEMAQAKVTQLLEVVNWAY